MSEKARVGDILVEAGVIDAMQLSSALGEQARWGRRIGVTLIKLGMVEEGHLIRALAKQLDLPVASLKGKRIADEVIALVPAQVASDHGVIPLFVKDEGRTKQLFLGMEDPSNLSVLDDLSFRTGMELHPVMVGPTELEEAMDRYYLGKASSRAMPAGSPEPIREGDAMGERSLRLVEDDELPPAPVTVSPVAAPVTPVEPVTPVAAPVTPVEPAPPIVAAAPVEAQSPVAPATSASTLSLPDGLLDDVAYAIDETERTRLVAKAIVQLLIEKGVVSLDEVQAQIAKLKAEVPS